MLKSQAPNWTYSDRARPLPAADVPHVFPWHERYQTFRALSVATDRALRIRDFQLTRDRYIIFSDLHKGSRHPKIDVFQHNEQIYSEALRYYLDQDYRLILNGDIEEGWKDDFRQVFAAYEHTAYAMERAFAAEDRHYFRTYGNHDDDWANPRKVDRFLKPMFGPINVYPAIILGSRIVIAHGHQGELHSDRNAWLSQRVVRYIWRPIQLLTGLQERYRPSENHAVYTPRDQHLSAWAQANHLLLIAGHTHRPMLNNDRAPLFSAPYINDGCCVHDHAITGLELDQGEIRLVKWDTLRRTVLKSADLGALLAGL
jgi:UDP-2,3-diacylglucosamine pyrophosphatase LpxH